MHRQALSIWRITIKHKNNIIIYLTLQMKKDSHRGHAKGIIIKDIENSILNIKDTDEIKELKKFNIHNADKL